MTTISLRSFLDGNLRPIHAGDLGEYAPLVGWSRCLPLPTRRRSALVAEHWDDLLRLAGSLKLGVVRAASLTRTF